MSEKTRLTLEEIDARYGEHGEGFSHEMSAGVYNCTNGKNYLRMSEHLKIMASIS